MRVLPGLLCMTLACSALAQKDAAEKVQEGNVNNWIEYYKKEREPAASPPSPSAGQNPAAEGERSKVKGERSKVKGESKGVTR